MNELPIIGLERCHHIVLQGLLAIHQDAYDTPSRS